MSDSLRYRLGLDLGTNSLGWAILRLDGEGKPCGVVRLGSRIFSNGRTAKGGTSLASDRRLARSMRRRRDRYIRRRTRFLDALVAAGLFPEDPGERKSLTTMNPWRLRAEGIDQELAPYELGRALFHLQQRRGFRSNRKVDRTAEDDKELNGLKAAINEFRNKLDGRTVGQELWARIQRGEYARARLVGSGKDARYTFYVDRAMVADEFDALWEAQRRHHPELLTEESRQTLRDTLLYQRDLWSPPPGKCYFNRDEARLALSAETAQLFRLYQEVNHLRLRNTADQSVRPLTRAERDAIIDRLANVKEATFPQLRKAALGAKSSKFTLTIEQGNRKKLKGNEVAAILGRDEAFGDSWHELSLDERDEIADLVAHDENERHLTATLINDYGRTAQQAQWIAEQSLPDDHLRVGHTAARSVLGQLVEGWDEDNDQPLSYDRAVAAAGLGSHSRRDGGALYDSLPYYGEVLTQYTAPVINDTVADERQWGRIGNPTVHIGLNQVRKVVNAIIDRYGKPAEIVIEIARELKIGEFTKADADRKQKEGQDRNEALARKLGELGVPNNHENRLRLRLYDELGDGALPHVCVYTGRTISLERLFTPDYQIDHILPLSRTLDDGYANKVLVHHSANRYKGNRGPYEAFASSPDYEWEHILERARTSLPPNKARRFSPTAMEAVEEQGGFLARQLTDTQYLSRVAKQYLDALFDDRTEHSHVWVTPGRLTGLLRGKWGLNGVLGDKGKKNRDDHRHHAVDAAVIAVTDRDLLRRVATAAGRATDKDLDRYFEGFPDPWESFREEIAQAAARIVVSHKPDHGTAAALHNDTAYGIVAGPDEKGVSAVRHYVELTSLVEGDLEKLREDPRFMSELEDCFSLGGKKEHQAALAKLAAKSGRHRVRKYENLTVIPIYRPGEKALDGAEPYKGYKGDSNYCYEIFEGEKGSWQGRIITTFEAASSEYRDFMQSSRFRTTTWSGEKLVMRIMANDYVILTVNDSEKLTRVQKISNGKITLAPPNEANVAARDSDKTDPFSFICKSPGSLNKARARRVFVDPLGSVRDPGSPVR